MKENSRQNQFKKRKYGVWNKLLSAKDFSISVVAIAITQLVFAPVFVCAGVWLILNVNQLAGASVITIASGLSFRTVKTLRIIAVEAIKSPDESLKQQISNEFNCNSQIETQESKEVGTNSGSIPVVE